MAAKGRVFKNETDVRISTQVQVWELTPDLFAFKRTVVPVVVSETGTMDAQPLTALHDHVQGLVNAENLNAMLRGEAWVPDALHSVFTDEDQEFLCSDDAIIYGQDLRRVRNVSSVYDDLAMGLITRKHIFRFIPRLSIFLDLDGHVMPEVVAFSGHEDRMNDTHYNMRRLVEHLSARGDIRFFREGGHNEVPQTFEGTVFTIDRVRYPEIRGRNAVLFAWSPSQEDSQLLWSTLSRNPEIRSPADIEAHLYAAVFDLDLLGLRAAKAALWTVF